MTWRMSWMSCVTRPGRLRGGVGPAMEVSPGKFLLCFFGFSFIGWLIVKFAATVLAWIFSRIFGGPVQFRFAGFNCLRDVSVKLKKGAVESIAIGEIKLSFRKSLVKLGQSMISRDPKLQLLLSDLEVVIRHPQRRKSKVRFGTQRARSASRGKWMLITNIIKYLSVTVTELIVKMPKATCEVKELKLDIFKDGASSSSLGVKLQLLPCNIFLGMQHTYEQDSSFSLKESILSVGRKLSSNVDKDYAPFYLEELLVICQFGYARDGVAIKHVEGTCGEVLVNLSEDVFNMKKPAKDSTEDSNGSKDFNPERTENLESPKISKAEESFPTSSAEKYLLAFPEKVSFSLPKLNMTCFSSEGLRVQNNIMGIQLRSTKSKIPEEMGDSISHLDIQIDCSEMHCLKEGSTSILEILKVVVSTSLDIPRQLTMPFRAEVDIKLGGTQCNLLINWLKPWMDLYFKHRMKKNLSPMQLSNKPLIARSSHSDLKSIMWTCTVSAPETTVILYNLNDAPIYLVSSQSSHLFVNNITSEKISVHMELGELLLHVADEDHGSLKESLFSVETSSESLLHISRVSVDWGLKEIESVEDGKTEQRKLTLAVEVSGSSTCLSLQRLQLLVFTFMSYAAVLKSASAINNRAKKRKGNSNSKLGGNGINVIRLNLEKFNVKFVGDLNVENTDISDPKRVNFGSQGGEVIITEVEEGKTRVAYVKSSSDTRLELKCITSFNMVHFSLCRDKSTNSTQLEMERGKIMYQEVAGDKTFGDFTLLALQSGKVVYQVPNNNGINSCALVCATDVTIRWEPDVHLVLYETMLRMKSLLKEQRNLSNAYVANTFIFNADKDYIFEGIRRSTGSDFQGSDRNDKQPNKELVLAVDIEQLTLSASLADGVECLVKVQSIFSEDAKIGMLFEDLGLSLNEATVFKSNRLQISRIPTSPEGGTGTISSSHGEIRSSIIWDCIIQGCDVRIIMPHKLQLHAIEDAVEDMYRGLKLVMAAKRQSLCPSNMKTSKHSKNRSSKFGCIKFSFREVIAEIEEEPIQGWLDEHYQLMKNEVCELSARLRFLDETVSEGSSLSGISELKEFHTKKFANLHENLEINSSDQDIVKLLQERLHQQAFQSYYKACQKLVISEGSGACRNRLQAGFRPSVDRSSLLSIRASNLEVTLTEIEGGKYGMIEMIRKLDCVSPEMEVPFSRMMGRNVSINTGSLVIQLRNYTLPMLAATIGKCNGSIILAQQATTFPPQYFQNVYIGRWHKVEMLRSMSGTTPPLKMYSELPIEFEKAEVAYGVGFEPAIADLSYAFTIALRKANLSIRNNGAFSSGNVPGSGLFPSGSHIHTNQTVKKERSLPWWDDMRYYIHGKNSIRCSDFKWNFLATTDPYEKVDKLQIVANIMDIQQSEGRLSFYAKEFKISISSLEHLLKNYDLKLPVEVRGGFIYSAAFQLDITMNWECESGNPLNHYLHALPSELEPRKKVYDPFRSTSFSLRWNFSLKPSNCVEHVEEVSSSVGDTDRFSGKVKVQVMSSARRSNTNRNLYDSASVLPPGKFGMVPVGIPTVNLGAHDLIWIFRWWNLYYNPPHKIRSFSKWPRFGVPRSTRSGNLSLDKVMTEFMLRVDATPTCIKHVPMGSDDPANGLTFNMKKLKYELCYSRGRQRYAFESKRDPLDQVYQGLDLHVLKAELKDPSTSSVKECSQKSKRVKPQGVTDSVGNEQSRENGITPDISNGDGLLLYTDYFTIRKQSPKVDPSRLLSWQEEGRSIRSLEATYVRSEFDYGSENDATLSDPSDDDGFNVVLADNCQRVFVYGLKLLWTIKNRDAVWAWVGEISKAFESPKPSPSRQYAQRKMIEEQQKLVGTGLPADDPSRLSASPKQSKGSNVSSSSVHVDKPISSPSPSRKMGHSSSASSALLKGLTIDETGEEGTMNFMVNVVQPQFNLHSEEANGAFLLAAASGRVLARSFHSVLHVGVDLIQKALGTGGTHIPGSAPEMTWKRRELSVILEHVQAHVAPTDVDPGAGLQWLPKIPRTSPELKRTGALLERVFMPCTMYFRYTRYKGGTTDLKIKPLKELYFNSSNITATMTSRQFHVMVDILSNLLLARLPKPRKSSLLHPDDEEEGIEEETDEVVPDGVEEVELARVKLEQAERECKLLLDDVRTIAVHGGFLSLTETDLSSETEDTLLWMMSNGKYALVQNLKKELSKKRKARKAASALLRLALQRAAQQRLMDKEKNKSPSFAMRISWAIDKVVWSLLSDGKAFAEAEISHMILNVDRDYKDVGVAEFATRSFVVRNCLANAKSDVVLSAWNPPTEWGRNFMLRVDAKQGAPKDGNSPLELFQVDIYPLRIYLTETMYKMMWEYFFPEEEQDSQKRQEVWKVSTTTGSKRGKRGLSSNQEQASTSSYRAREGDILTRSSAPGTPLVSLGNKQPFTHGDPSQLGFLMASHILEAPRLQSQKTTPAAGPSAEHRRTSSFDRSWEENIAESVANELVCHAQGKKMYCSNSGPLSTTNEHPSGIPTSATAAPVGSVDISKNRSREVKPIKPARSSHEEKKLSKSHEEKKVSRARRALEFQNIKISQVELLVTYEGSRLAFNDLRLLMDTFTLVDYTGTWRRLFGRVRKHIIWGVLKSVTGMQGKKFKDKVQGQRQADGGASPDSDLNFSDSDGSQPGKNDQFPITWFKKPNDRAGESFVTSIRGLFNSQRRKAKAFVLRTMRGDAENEFQGEWSESDTEFSPFARQLTMNRAKRLIRRHTKKFRSNRHKALPFLRDSFQSSPRTTPFQSEAESSSVSSAYEDFHD